MSSWRKREMGLSAINLCMFFLFLRLCPWLVAGLAILGSWWQWSVPALYPWPLLLPVSAYLLVGAAFLWRARHWREGLAALFPTFIALLVVGFGHLFVETTGLRVFTTGLFAFLPWFSLELAWFMLYDSAHYPSRAFLRLHMALVPICLWYILATLQEIHVFLPRVASWILVSACVVGVVVLFAGTAHGWREARERRWLWASILIALHLAALMLLLPTTLEVHGALAALLLAAPLRLRHIGRERTVSFSQLWTEGAVLLVVWLMILFTARWG